MNVFALSYQEKLMTAQKIDSNNTVHQANFYKLYSSVSCPVQFLQRKDLTTVGVQFISFSTDSRFMILYYQEIEDQQFRINSDSMGQFVAYDIQEKQICKAPEEAKNSAVAE